jgi:hypothetical protein
MDKMVEAHFVQFWEGKNEIMAVTTMKQFALTLAIDLFLSTTECLQFQSLAHDIDTCIEGALTPPIYFPGTKYHNGMLSHDHILHTHDTIICHRYKV